jgi:amino acid permease
LCSATLGAGILALPYALYQAGLIFGGIFLVSSAWATAASIHLLVQACEKYQLNTYEQVVERVLGRRMRQAVEISILLFCGGTAVAYVIAVGDIMERVEDLSSNRRRLAMAFVWILAMLPLSCLRRMQSLQCASTVGIASIGTLLIAATVHLVAPQDDDDNGSSFFSLSSHSLEPFFGPADGGWQSVLIACPIVVFAFSCQVNVCQIYDELPCRGGEEKVRAMGWVTWMAVGLCGLLYTSVSLVTLTDFGNDVTPNILSCYTLTPKETLLHVAFLAMALAVILAFPLNIFPARVSIIQMWSHSKPSGEQLLICTSDIHQEARQPLLSCHDGKSGYQSREDMERGDTYDPLLSPVVVASQESLLSEDTGDNMNSSDDDLDDDDDFHLGQHMLVTLLVAGSALGLALVVPNISVIFGLLGGTTSSLLGFIVPGLLGLEMSENRSNVSAWILVIAGTVIGLLTTGVTVYSTVREYV